MGDFIWLLILLLILIAVAAAVIVAMPSFRRAAQARRDYLAARGTIHRRELEQAVGKLPTLIAAEEGALREIDGSSESMGGTVMTTPRYPCCPRPGTS